ncbi:hypothetical protein H6G17_17570 [Chroococcidiopsis sp. FACHB-1243]|uniref:DUF5676 family membrane protein n=1 Tax=Chroococcidiopsis sp. [FACHB-1243] TaxID=2692781 RepID=UPI000D077E63|nr:DUF5676 family membrane protein [Chroococcidiopsis sp. [FACHB-1243]]MBD2307291.1 hypothetical protein [Chroococcidiopsis sp. [FACHB-1243]]PSB48919.1 hypothetical protein C7B80_04235 [Cyanosarcina cf. burmensis CCALA 770]
MLSNTHEREDRHLSRNSTKLRMRSLSIATAIVTGLVYTVCVLFIAVAPKAAMAFFSSILHIDLSSLARVVTWGSFIAGLLFWSLGSALYAALLARLYNSLAPR